MCFLSRRRQCVWSARIMWIPAYWSVALDFLTPFSCVSQMACSHNTSLSPIEFQCWGRTVLMLFLTWRGRLSMEVLYFSNFLSVSFTLILHHWVRKHSSKAAAFMLNEKEVGTRGFLLKQQIAQLTSDLPGCAVLTGDLVCFYISMLVVWCYMRTRNPAVGHVVSSSCDSCLWYLALWCLSTNKTLSSCGFRPFFYFLTLRWSLNCRKLSFPQRLISTYQ